MNSTLKGIYTQYIHKTISKCTSTSSDQTLVLAREWWTMYYNDLDIMKREISHAVEHKKPKTILSRPKSISILKKIVLIRVANEEHIRIEGAIDSYFFGAAAAPETQKDHVSSQSFRLKYKTTDNVFYTEIKLLSFRSRKARKTCNHQHQKLVQGLDHNPIVRFSVAGFGSVVNPLCHYSSLKSTIIVFDKVVKIFKNHKDDTKFVTENFGNFVWGIKLQNGLSLSYIRGLDYEDAVATRRCELTTACFFLLEYNGVSLVHHVRAEKIHQDTMERIFGAFEKNNVKLHIVSLQSEHCYFHNHKNFERIRRYVSQDRHVLDKECYAALKTRWAATKTKNEIQILRKAFSECHVQGEDKNSWPVFSVLRFDQMIPEHHRHVINTITQDPDMKDSVLYIEDGIGDMDLLKLGNDLLKFHVYIKTDIDHYDTIRNARSCSKEILDAVKRCDKIRKAVTLILNVLVKDAKKYDTEIVEILSRARLSQNYATNPYAHVIFKRGKDFGVSVEDDALVMCVGDLDIKVIKVLYDLICLLNCLYSLSMECIGFDSGDWKYHVRLCGFGDFKENKILMVMLSYSTIVEWLRFQLIGGEFDHRGVIQKEFLKQKPFFQQQKKELREANKALEKEGHYGKMRIVSSISAVFGHEQEA